MIDVKQALRTAYYNLLNGQLSYQAVAVPIGDEMTPFGEDVSLYVIIASQDGSDESTFQSWGSLEHINLDIVSKSGARNSKEPVDQVAGQIFALLFPDPLHKNLCGLPEQPGIQINATVFSTDRYIPLSLNSSNTVMRRILTFKQHVLQTL